MSTFQVCDTHPYTDKYWLWVAYLPLIILLNLLLLIHSCYHLYVSRESIPYLICISYITQQTVALLGRILFSLKFIIYPTYSAVSNTFFCGLTAPSNTLLTTLYYATSECILILRLNEAFKGTYLQIKHTTYKVLIIQLIIAYSLRAALLCVSDNIYILPWLPSDVDFDSDNSSYYICTVHNDTIRYFVIVLGTIYGAIVQLLILLTFVTKTYKAIRNVASTKLSQNVKYIMVRDASVMIAAIIITIIGFALWITIANSHIYLSVSALVNMILFALMLDHNEKYYQFCCKLCIKAANQCDVNVTEKVQRNTDRKPNDYQQQ